MITALLSSFLLPRRAALHLTALVGVAGLAAISSAHATVPAMATNGVVPNDTFSFDLVGYNTSATTNDIYLIQPGLSATFGTPQSYTADALGGQTLTITSTQTGTATNFVDTITISVPTNFVPAGTKDNAGNIINGIVFSIGVYQGGTDTLDFSTSLAGAGYGGSVSGTMQVTTSLSGVQNPVLTNGNKSLSNEEGVQTYVTGTTTPRDISANGINQFTFTVAVPEPSTYATVLLGAAGLCWLTVARRRARA